mmetsp:Transcript_12911/g.24247  ORF Transcript_12911/g.24247 Transcript_12911/m.24247 type:complete len:219 (-) Transcript_12911:467-1123(-)
MNPSMETPCLVAAVAAVFVVIKIVEPFDRLPSVFASVMPDFISPKYSCLKPFALTLELERAATETNPPIDAAMPSPSATLITSVAVVGKAASKTFSDIASNCSIESPRSSTPSAARLFTVASFPVENDNISRMKLKDSSDNCGASSTLDASVNITPVGIVTANVDITAISKSVRLVIMFWNMEDNLFSFCFPALLPLPDDACASFMGGSTVLRFVFSK